MQLLGALVNGAAICVGGGVGLVLKNGLKEQYRDMLIGVMGLSVLFSGISTAMGGLLDEAVEPLLFIVSLVLGAWWGRPLALSATWRPLAIGCKVGLETGEAIFPKAL